MNPDTNINTILYMYKDIMSTCDHIKTAAEKMHVVNDVNRPTTRDASVQTECRPPPLKTMVTISPEHTKKSYTTAPTFQLCPPFQ